MHGTPAALALSGCFSGHDHDGRLDACCRLCDRAPRLRHAVRAGFDDPAAFPRAAFGEGGYAQLTSAVASDLARNGLRVLLVCSTTPCEPTFGRARDRLERAGVSVRLTSSGGSKHMFAGAVAEATRGQWPWLVEGDPLWSAANP